MTAKYTLVDQITINSYYKPGRTREGKARTDTSTGTAGPWLASCLVEFSQGLHLGRTNGLCKFAVALPSLAVSLTEAGFG